ncbi:PREDICTED: vam6/Vps39-like protein [Priapulus caudatus]|uniref:Vam6/Vps39-like protein n=1 Tax=Priapulus caudatus TaxID=37621 RepID=A0ABM1EFT1_PRICU|nr:PREDICTED: vam6/Vps39-like protein [Priapulus caudatus]
MHDAYEAVAILEKLPLQIESIASYENNLLVGTKQGHLLMYCITPHQGDQKFEVRLLRSNKHFSKRPIIQMEVVPELQILISLSDAVISVHDLTVFNLITTINKTRGASVFTLDVQNQVSLSGNISTTLRMCVAVRRKLQLFYWKNRNFHELQPDLGVPDVAKCMVWCGDSLCVGFKTEYFIIKTETGNLKDLFPMGKNEPRVTKLEDKRLALGKDDMTIFLDWEGNATQKFALTWSDMPIALEYNAPYLVGVLPRYVEIRTVESRSLIQSIELSKPRYVTTCHKANSIYVGVDVARLCARPVPSRTRECLIEVEEEKKERIHQIQTLFAFNSVLSASIQGIHGSVHTAGHVTASTWASTSHVLVARPVPVKDQVKQLVQQKQFELALQLVELSDEVARGEEGEDTIRYRLLFAFNLFYQASNFKRIPWDFLFIQLDTDPSHVIGLFPGLLPPDFRSQLEYPEKLPELAGADLENGFVALIEYLTQVRMELVKDMTKQVQFSSATIEGAATVKLSQRQQLQIIDTTLLKCYLQTNDALIAPLLRLRDNHCHLDESERVLKKHQKFSELIILYQRKNLHKRALDLLLKQAMKPDSALKGHERTVQYLQHLGRDHLPLIFEFSSWVLKAHPEDGLKIFTDDLPEVELLPRDKILQYLQQHFPDLVIPYLEHVVLEWDDTSPHYHNSLVNHYRQRVQALTADYLDSLPEGQLPRPHGMEPGELGELRNKLVFFLESSTHYVAQAVLVHFPFDAFFEERAILLGRLGRHEQALAIYIYVICDLAKAEEYCRRNYSKTKDSSKDVFLTMFKILVVPPDPTMIGVMLPQLPNPEPQPVMALELLRLHANKIDTIKALQLLPLPTRVCDIHQFLEKVLQERASHKRRGQILRSLLSAEHLQVQEQIIFHQAHKIVITDENICRVCKKKIGNSAFARYPNGVLVHYYCCKDVKICPVEL